MASSVPTSPPPTSPPQDRVVEQPPTRRDFLYIATGAMGAVGAALALWPLIDQMNPAADVLAAAAPLEIDISKIAPGQQIEVIWRSMPIFIVHRTPALLAKLKAPALLSRLRDPQSEEIQQPPYAENWSRSLKPNILVLVGICTHLGCIPEFRPAIGDATLGADWPGGFFCPCHGSRYDMAGRVFQGVPAPFNLPVPPYHFASDTILVLGENPPGQTFSISSIGQM